MFTPQDNNRPKWAPVFDLIESAEPGDLITYKTLEETLGYDVRTNGRSAIYAASKRALERLNRTLAVVKDQGYRVALASEHFDLAKAKQIQARRRIRRGIALAVHVDSNQLDTDQQRAIDGLANVLMAQNAMLKRHDRRISRVEGDVSQVDDRVAALEATLAAHGIIVRQETILGEASA